MKKTLSILLLSCTLAYGQGSRLQPGSVPTPVPVFDTTLISNLVYAQASAIVSNFFNTTNGTTIVNNITTEIVTNYYMLNMVTNIFLGALTYDVNHILNMNTNLVGTYNGTTNTYWINCGYKYNGRTNIYGTLTATNDILFLGVTNAQRGSLFSFNVVSSGGNRRLCFPVATFNYPLFTTNDMDITSDPTYTTLYTLTLTNGNLFRMTFQSNSVGEFIWTTAGQ